MNEALFLVYYNTLYRSIIIYEGGYCWLYDGGEYKNTRPYRRVEWQRPIFPWGYPHSIVRAGRLNGRVRDGNGCFPSAIVTTPPACTGGSLFSFFRLVIRFSRISL